VIIQGGFDMTTLTIRRPHMIENHNLWRYLKIHVLNINPHMFLTKLVTRSKALQNKEPPHLQNCLHDIGWCAGNGGHTGVGLGFRFKRRVNVDNVHWLGRFWCLVQKFNIGCTLSCLRQRAPNVVCWHTVQTNLDSAKQWRRSQWSNTPNIKSSNKHNIL